MSRFIFRDILFAQNLLTQRNKTTVAIYGAGSAGATLQSALLLSPLVDVVLFFDDSPNLWYRNLNGVPIQPPQKFSKNSQSYSSELCCFRVEKGQYRSNYSCLKC